MLKLKSDKPLSYWLIVFNFAFAFVSVLSLVLFLTKIELYLKICAYVLIGLVTLAVVVLNHYNKETLCKSLFSINGFIAFILLILVILNVSGIFENFSDVEKIKILILDSKSLGVIIYFLAIVFQVVVLPVPALLFYLAGTAIYGPLYAFLISYVATVVGSFIAYFIGKGLGRKVVYWCVGESTALKYEKMLGSKGYLLFAIMQLLPFFPDDVLCMLAGLISMRFSVFSLIILLIRPIYILLACFLGTGNLIPFTGWGIPVWISAFILMGGLFFLYCKHQTKIENFFIKKFKK